MTIVWFCFQCSQDTVFEQPLCADEHGSDCPEWLCVQCGYAVVLGSVYADAQESLGRAAA